MTPDHVDWGMSKMTPSTNARASSTLWNCFPFSFLLTEGNKNQPQGAKSGEYGVWVTSWTSLAARKSRVPAAVAALALSWWSSRPRTPVWGRRLHNAWKILGKQWLAYQSAVTVFLSSCGMVAKWPNLAQKHAIICLEALLFFSEWVVGSHLGRPTPPTVASSRGRIGILRFLILLRCPKREETFLCQIFLACGCTSPPYPASALHSGHGAPSGHNVYVC